MRGVNGMRRTVGTVAMMILAAAIVVPGLAEAQPQALTVAVYGGEWGEAISRAILRPFEEKTGIRIVVEPGVSTVTLAKLRQQKDNPVIDVAWMDGGISEIALSEGLVETLDVRRLANVPNMVPEAVYKTKDGKVYALSTGFYALGLVYNSAKVQVPPASFLDLFRPEFAGKFTMPSPANAMGIPLFIFLAEIRGGSINNMRPAVELLREAKPRVFFDTSGLATNLFQSGEVIVGAHYASAAWYMVDKVLPIRYAVPKEGALAGDIRIHVVRGTRNGEAAQKLVDFAVSKEAQKALAEFIYVAPTAKGVILSPKARARMPYGPAGSMKDLRIPNWDLINAKRAELTELWNKEVVRR
jgi:putative spermidine/putrescine transport system substrate-binding protein